MPREPNRSKNADCGLTAATVRRRAPRPRPARTSPARRRSRSGPSRRAGRRAGRSRRTAVRAVHRRRAAGLRTVRSVPPGHRSLLVRRSRGSAALRREPRFIRRATAGRRRRSRCRPAAGRRPRSSRSRASSAVVMPPDADQGRGPGRPGRAAAASPPWHAPRSGGPESPPAPAASTSLPASTRPVAGDRRVGGDDRRPGRSRDGEVGDREDVLVAEVGGDLHEQRHRLAVETSSARRRTAREQRLEPARPPAGRAGRGCSARRR